MNSGLLRKALWASLLCFLWTAPVAWAVAAQAADAPDAAAANSDDNPYAVIVERNVFHLNPEPPPKEPEKPKVELPPVKITGFVNIKGHKTQVLFFSQPKDRKEGPIYYSLTEGEKGGEGGHSVELLKIHPGQNAVDILNDGVPATLSAKDDSLAASQPPVAPAGGPPGPREAPLANPPPPGVDPRTLERRIFHDRATPPGGSDNVPLRLRRNPPQPQSP